jgi:hypothetical protein
MNLHLEYSNTVMLTSTKRELDSNIQHDET